MDKKLLSILCCPVTRKGLSLAKRELLDAVNEAMSLGERERAEQRENGLAA